MSNIFKRVGLLLIGILSITTVLAKTPDTITLNSVTPISKYGTTFNVNMKKGLNGEYVYCIEANKSNLYENNVLKLEGEISDAGVIYLAKYGFPTTIMTGDNNKDYFITQVATWWYYQTIYGIKHEQVPDLENGSLDNVEIVKYVKELYNGAVKAHSEGIKVPSISLNGNNNLKLSSDGKYYESELVTVNLISLSSYSVTLENNNLNFIITDKDNNAKDTFLSNEQFKIRVLASEVSNQDIYVVAKVKTSGTTDKAYSYKPENEDQQRTLYSAIISTPISFVEEIAFGYKFSDIEISKVDITTQQELAGATLEIRDSEGNLIDSWVSNGTTHYVKLKPGKYSLSETTAPEGYEKSTEVVEFNVYENGKSEKIVFTNVPITDLDASQVAVLMGGGFLVFGMGLVLKNAKSKESK